MNAKYLAALIAIVLTVLNALQTAIVGGVEPSEIAQLVIVAGGAIIVRAVPLVKGKWAGLLKTGLSIVVAVATALAPLLITGMIAPEQWITVVLAGVQAIAVQYGVTARTDAVNSAAAIIDAGVHQPGVPLDITSLPVQNAIATLAADPAASKVVLGTSSLTPAAGD